MHSGKTLDTSVRNETELCFTRPRWTDIQRRCPDTILGRHVGLCVSTTFTVTQDLIQRLHSIVNSPSFTSSSVVPNFVKTTCTNRDTSQVTSKQKNTQPLSHVHVFHPQSEALCLCLYISKSKHQQRHISYYCSLKNFRCQNKISATAYILLHVHVLVE